MTGPWICRASARSCAGVGPAEAISAQIGPIPKIPAARAVLPPRSRSSRRSMARTLEPRGDALGEAEGAAPVVLPLHCDQTPQVRPVVGVLPRLQVGVDVVLVRKAGDER